MTIIKYIPTDEAMQALGVQMALATFGAAIFFLQGQLGAGKTTFTRGFLRGLGYNDKVKSPTYTLVEPYEISERSLYHFDLYRLAQPSELSHLGIEDYLSPGAICIIEWPEKGEGYLPTPDVTCQFIVKAQGRELHLSAHTPQGEAILQHL